MWPLLFIVVAGAVLEACSSEKLPEAPQKKGEDPCESEAAYQKSCEKAALLISSQSRCGMVPSRNVPLSSLAPAVCDATVYISDSENAWKESYQQLCYSQTCKVTGIWKSPENPEISCKVLLTTTQEGRVLSAQNSSYFATLENDCSIAE